MSLYVFTDVHLFVCVCVCVCSHTPVFSTDVSIFQYSLSLNNSLWLIYPSSFKNSQQVFNDVIIISEQGMEVLLMVEELGVISCM